MIKQVIVLGIHPLATKIVRDLQQRRDVNVYAVITTPYSKSNLDIWNEACLYDYAIENGIRLFESVASFLEFLNGKQLDLALNIRFPKILKKNFIDSFSLGVVNTHGGLLPMRAGANIPCFNILLDDKESGCTMHFIDEGIDSGDIIDYKRFPVEPDDTAFSLFQKTQNAIWNVYSDNIDAILKNNSKRQPQKEMINNGVEKKYFKTKDLNSLKKINLEKMTLSDIERYVRAFDFPGHEPAYFEYNGRKVYLTSQQFFLNK